MSKRCHLRLRRLSIILTNTFINRHNNTKVNSSISDSLQLLSRVQHEFSEKGYHFADD